MSPRAKPGDFGLSSKLTSWLDDANRDSSRLAAWLGGDLPPAGHEDEPYVQLLHALPLGNRRAFYEQELGRSAAELVRQLARNRLSDSVAYNLLRLSAGLRGRDALADPLYAVYKAGTLTRRSYSIHRLRDALRSALIVNQRDNRLEPEWRSMLRGTKTPALGGLPRDGFEGILHMPPSETARGKPAVEAITAALTAMAKHLDSDRQSGVQTFRALLASVSERYPARAWALKFVRMSDENGWPRWTDVALPDLYMQVQANTYLLWWATFELIRRLLAATVLERYCRGRIIKARLSAPVRAKVKRAAIVLERYRLEAWDGGTPGEVGILSSALPIVKKQLPSGTQSAADEVHDEYVTQRLPTAA